MSDPRKGHIMSLCTVTPTRSLDVKTCQQEILVQMGTTESCENGVMHYCTVIVSRIRHYSRTAHECQKNVYARCKGVCVSNSIN